MYARECAHTYKKTGNATHTNTKTTEWSATHNDASTSPWSLSSHHNGRTATSATCVIALFFDLKKLPQLRYEKTRYTHGWRSHYALEIHTHLTNIIHTHNPHTAHRHEPNLHLNNGKSKTLSGLHLVQDLVSQQAYVFVLWFNNIDVHQTRLATSARSSMALQLIQGITKLQPLAWTMPPGSSVYQQLMALQLIHTNPRPLESFVSVDIF